MSNEDKKDKAIRDKKVFDNYYNSVPALNKDGKKQKPDLGYAEKLFNLFYARGVVIDGVNAVFSGSMVQLTYHGYKNAVYSAYPDAEIDVQVVREGDDFKVSKESGDVIYSHQVANPFQNTKIIGAYCIIKTRRGNFLETLNPADFEEMKKASKTALAWNKWESEFWKKCVIKRACKTHLYDIVQELDKEDNKNYKLEDELASDDRLDEIVKANTSDEPTS